MTKERSVESLAAQFHRLLAELLLALSQDAQVAWLEGQPHQLYPHSPMRNAYRCAIYMLPSLSPYESALAALAEAQRNVLLATQKEKPPHSLLLPVVREKVISVRKSSVAHHRSVTFTREQLIEFLEGLVATTTASAQVHERVADDARTRAIQSELQAYKRVLQEIKAEDESLYRVRYNTTRHRPRLVYEDGAAEQVIARKHGLIVTGEDISVTETPPRVPRNDRMRLEPFFIHDTKSFYRESDWQAEKGSS